jgi:hypothetical protein
MSAAIAGTNAATKSVTGAFFGRPGTGTTAARTGKGAKRTAARAKKASGDRLCAGRGSVGRDAMGADARTGEPVGHHAKVVSPVGTAISFTRRAAATR